MNLLLIVVLIAFVEKIDLISIILVESICLMLVLLVNYDFANFVVVLNSFIVC